MKTEYTRTQKAFLVAHYSHINTDYLPETECERIYAETPSKAKIKYIQKGYDYKFIELRAKRQKGADRYLFEGESMVMGEIERRLEYRKWLDDMKSLIENNPTAKVYIRSGQWGAYWGANRCGYTNDKSQAGIYDINDAWKAVSHVGLEKQISFVILPHTGAVGSN